MLANDVPVVPCGWHQRIIISALFLRSLIPRGLRLGFLISPSREGEFISRVALAHEALTIRGSSSRTGREAMVALVRAVRSERISPTMYGDGPRGPAGVFKPGAAILARRTGAPLFLVGCAASRYWQLGSWDKGRIPKPFARITIAVGEPWPIGELEDAQHADRISEEIGHRLDELDRVVPQPKVLAHTACTDMALVEILGSCVHARVPKPAPVDVLLRAVIDALDLPVPQ